jgi:hypothetical protein
MKANDDVSSDERISYTGPLPGLVDEICHLARQNALDVSVLSEDGGIVVVVTGSESAFRAARFVPGDFRFPVRYRELKDGAFKWSLTRIGADAISGEMSFEAPTQVSAIEGASVQECRYADARRHSDWAWINRRALWGYPPDVERAAGLRSGILKKGRQSIKGNGAFLGPHAWTATYMPSGKVHYLVEESNEPPSPIEVARDNALNALRDGLQGGPLHIDSAHCELSFGTQSELITSGVCTVEQFPTGRRRTADGTTLRNGEECRWSIELHRGGYFEFCIQKTKAERAAARMDTKERGDEYGSPSAYNTYARLLVRRSVNMIRNVTHGFAERRLYGETTLLYDSATLESVSEALDQIEEAMRSGTVRWTPVAARRKREVAAAKADPVFRTFLNRLGISGRGSSSLH